MNAKLDKKLVKKFPNLYRDRYSSMMETCMCWGFPGDGWFDLIWGLSEKLEKLIKKIPKKEREYCCASQVKEKFGSMSFYMSSATDEMWKLIQKAEHESQFICETCGKPGRIMGHGWLYCSCLKCAKEDSLTPTELFIKNHMPVMGSALMVMNRFLSPKIWFVKNRTRRLLRFVLFWRKDRV